jgi:hypothetical protein
MKHIEKLGISQDFELIRAGIPEKNITDLDCFGRTNLAV